jgi:FMN hydrolase / 5-amino-6-(5-phospho-D-ribitylamino)uracil phosphatase
MITPRVISLDLDDTLWPVAPVIASAEAALQSWLREHHPRAVLGLSVDSMRDLRTRVAERFPLRSHDLTFLRRQALAEMFAAAGYPDGPAVDDAFEIFLSQRNRVEFYADVRPALERLRAKYRLFALSNGNADLERCGVADLFDGHVTASAAGAAKPDARIYAHLLRAAGVLPIEVLHVGDDPLADVVGATRAGLQAVWLNRDARTWPEQFAPPARTVTTLADIL